MAPTEPKWISSEEAAEILGLSKRRVLEFAQTGALKSQRIRDPRTNQVATRLDGWDVEKLREERENPKPQPSQGAEGSEPQAPAVRGGVKSQTSALSKLPVAGLVEALESITGRNHSHWPLYLSIAEARQYSGLTDEAIQTAAREGKVRKIGVKYRRADLEAL